MVRNLECSHLHLHKLICCYMMAKLTELANANTTQKVVCSWAPGFMFFALGTIALAMLVVQLDTFETVAYPMHELGESMFVAARKNAGSLPGVEKIGMGQLIGAEDILYDPKSGVVYTGCQDGWIKRVTLNDSVAESVVENWVHTGGRPLGLAIDQFGVVFVADAYKRMLFSRHHEHHKHPKAQEAQRRSS